MALKGASGEPAGRSWVNEFSAQRTTSHLASDCCAAGLSSSACHSMPAVFTPRASSAARSPGMREITQICGSRDSIGMGRVVAREVFTTGGNSGTTQRAENTGLLTHRNTTF